jgi:hypothetical protein
MVADLKLRPPPLPAKIEDWTRFMKIERTLNDLVEDAHRILIDKKEYRVLLEAVWDEDAVEGSLSFDNCKAAELIRNWAKTQSGHELAGKKLATISKSLSIVLRRYHSSRNERRHMVDGAIVTPAQPQDRRISDDNGD